MDEPSDIHQAWRSIEFRSRTSTLGEHPAVGELLRVYGQVAVAEFGIAKDDRDYWRAFRQSMWRPQWDFTTRLLDSEAFACAVPELAAPRRSEPGFEQLFSYHLGGEFARLLHEGGAYLRVKDIKRAETLAQEFVWAVLGPARIDVDIRYAHDAWHPWFADVAWDRTFVILNWSTSNITFLAATSND